MNSFEAYVMYLSLKRHFSDPKYDYFKYNKKTKVSVSTFEKRNDKHFFKKLSNHPDLENYFIGNCIKNPDFWVGNVVENEANYTEYSKNLQGLLHYYEESLKQYEQEFVDLVRVEFNKHPQLLKDVLANRFSIVSLTILMKLMPKFKEYWDVWLGQDILWKDIKLKVEKLSPFIKIDTTKFKKRTKEIFEDRSHFSELEAK